jgi:hypothetical protein
MDEAVRSVGVACGDAGRLGDLHDAAGVGLDGDRGVGDVLDEVLSVLSSNADEIGEIGSVFADSVDALDERLDVVVDQLEAARREGGVHLLLGGLAGSACIVSGVAYHEVVSSYVQYLLPIVYADVDGVVPSVLVSVGVTFFVSLSLVMYYMQWDLKRLDEFERRVDVVRGKRQRFIELTEELLGVSQDLRSSGQ